MGCDYYIQTTIVIEYLNKMGNKSVIYTNQDITKGYIFSYQDYDSDDDVNTKHTKYMAELERKINECIYDKVLFENDKWIKESYRKKYEEQLKTEFKEITNIKKIYKKTAAWKRN